MTEYKLFCQSSVNVLRIVNGPGREIGQVCVCVCVCVKLDGQHHRAKFKVTSFNRAAAMSTSMLGYAFNVFLTLKLPYILHLTLSYLYILYVRVLFYPCGEKTS